jgi:hypothetical protein
MRPVEIARRKYNWQPTQDAEERGAGKEEEKAQECSNRALAKAGDEDNDEGSKEMPVWPWCCVRLG